MSPMAVPRGLKKAGPCHWFGAQPEDRGLVSDRVRLFQRPAFQPLCPKDAGGLASCASLTIDRGCSFRYEATGRNDNTVRLGGIVIDIPAGPRRISYTKARVDVGQLLDGRNFLDIGFSSYDNNRVIGGLKLTV
jgi:hypothetical protein